MPTGTSFLSNLQMMGVEATHVSPIPNAPSHFLEHATLNAFLNMQTAAKADGIDLQVCSSFRSFDKQLSIWNRKWTGVLPILDMQSKLIRTDKFSDAEKIHSIMHWSALPGASRHHWGTDFDVYDKQSVERHGHRFELIPSEYCDGGPCFLLNQWLEKHAIEFGFYRPYEKYNGGVAREPWHYSYQASASLVIEQFELASLHTQLAESEILGKQTVLELLPSLFTQYTLNHGIPK